MAHASQQPGCIGLVLYDEHRDYKPDVDLPAPINNGTASRILRVGTENGSISRVVRERSLPGIVLGHSSKARATTSILPDYYSAARLALGLLARLGHRHIGIVGDPFGDPEPRFAEMSHSIASVAHELGLPIEAENVFHGNLTFEAGVTAVNTMRARSSTPSALLCLTDTAAIGALAAAHVHGIRVPEDLSVIAFADHAEMLDSCIPLTAVVLPVDEMAAAAVKEADRQLESGIPPTSTQIIIPVRLIERSTCGPARV
jgi:LacI family transcriptional regulator